MQFFLECSAFTHGSHSVSQSGGTFQDLSLLISLEAKRSESWGKSALPCKVSATGRA